MSALIPRAMTPWRTMVLVVFMLCTAPAGVAAMHPFANSRMADVDGVRMHYRYWGNENDRPVASVLLIHGFGGSTYSWQGVADSLNAMGYEVVAVDIPPFGYSDKSHTINQSLTAHAERIHRFVYQEYPGRRWHLAGHSMGGAISQAYALMYPDDLKSVTFISAALFPELPRTEQQINFFLRLSPLRYFFGELAEEWVIRERRMERMLESAYGVPPTKEQVQAYLEPLEIPGTARAILSAAAYHKEIARLDASDLRVPSVAIWGDADNWVSYESRLPSLDRMPETDVIFLEGVGHNPMETNPDALMDAWLPFLESVTSRHGSNPGMRIYYSGDLHGRQDNLFVSVLSQVIRESVTPVAPWDQITIPFAVPQRPWEHVTMPFAVPQRPWEQVTIPFAFPQRPWENLPSVPQIDETSYNSIKNRMAVTWQRMRNKASSLLHTVRSDIQKAPVRIRAYMERSE